MRARRAAQLDGRFAFVRRPIAIVSRATGTGTFFVHVRRRLPRKPSGPVDATLLLNGRADWHGVIAAEGWARCYWQDMGEALPPRLPRHGERVRVTLKVRRRVRARAMRVRVRHVSREQIADELGYDEYFRRLGCRRR